jgi:hypothetical protein
LGGLAGADARAAAIVRLTVPEVQVLYYGDVVVALESGDGAPHRVRVHVQPPPGLQAPDAVKVAVPAAGQVTASVRLWRSSAPRGSRQSLMVVAEPIDGAEAAVSAPAFAQILPDPAWMPRLRRPLGVLALVLMSAAALVEVRRRL